MPEHLCYAECLWADEPWTDVDGRPRVECWYNAPGGLAPSVVARMGILGAPCPFAEALEAEARRRRMVEPCDCVAKVAAYYGPGDPNATTDLGSDKHDDYYEAGYERAVASILAMLRGETPTEAPPAVGCDCVEKVEAMMAPDSAEHDYVDHNREFVLREVLDVLRGDDS